MPRFGRPHPEVVACGIYHGDVVTDRESGKLGLVVALSSTIPGVYVRWDRKDGMPAQSHTKKLVHLDAIRLL